MDDVASHAARQAIEFAVANRLVDGYSDRRFRPDAYLRRGEMAQYLVMGASVRQYLPFDGVPTFDDMSTTDAAYLFAESAVAQGAPLRDLSQRQDGVMGLLTGDFRGNDDVTRVVMAYSMGQSPRRPDTARPV